jgi:hypothetical protein
MTKTRVLLAAGVLAATLLGGAQGAYAHGGEDDGDYGITSEIGETGVTVDGATVTSDPNADSSAVLLWGAGAIASIGAGAGLYLVRRKRPGTE